MSYLRKLSKSIPPPTPASDKAPQQSLKELVPNNFSVFPDIVKALRSRNFLLYFSGQMVSLTGFWIQQVAMSWLILRLSPEGDLAPISVVIFLGNAPTFFLTPFSGLVSDIFDRRKILIITQTLLMLFSFAVAILTLTDLVNIPIIMFFAFLSGVVISFDAPARQSFYSKLVPMEDLSNAIALNSISMNGTRLIGPAVAGVLIGIIGEGWCFLINSCSFMGVLFSLLLIKVKPSPRHKTDLGALGQIKEGFVYIFSSVPLRSIILMIAAFSFFGVPFVMLFPAFVKDILMQDSKTLGILMSSLGVGALTAALYLAARKSVLGLGKVVMFACMIFGGALLCMAFVRSVPLAILASFPLGFGMIAVAASCNTLLQTIVDDNKRGRVMSIFTMSFFGIPPMGSLFFGFLGNTLGLANMMCAGGFLCLIAGLAFMYFRPIVRKHTRKIYVEKGIISEIAVGLRSTNPPV